MKFEGIICQLLLKHDCVIVPGLGGFVTFYKSAVIHPINNSIQPPSRQLGFNRHLTNSDGLLLNSYVKTSGLDLKIAQAELDQWTMQISNQLANGQKAHLLGIGTLWNDLQGQIQFVPSDQFITNFTSFGLKAIQLPSVQSKEVLGESNWKKIAVAASVAALIVSGVFLFENKATKADTAGWNPEWNNQNQNWLERHPVPTFIEKNNQVNFQKEYLDLWNSSSIENLNKTKESQKESVVAEKNNIVKQSDSAHSSSVKMKTDWGRSWVVGGVFKSKQNAQEKVDDMRRSGFSGAKIIPFQDYFYAVYGTANNDQQEAKLRADVLTVDPRAWTKR